MLNGKKIAVVVPAMNEEKQIRSVIETMPDFVDRIVVVNDGSTDRTAEIVKDCIKKNQKNGLVLTALSRPQNTKYNEAEIRTYQIETEKEEPRIPSVIVNPDPSNRIVLINHVKKAGVGAAIARGYYWCKIYGIDCTVVMAGDGQMDPSELHAICYPVVVENVDYVKGNRLIHRSAWLVIPKLRYLGNSILSIFNKIASGYWRVSDTQCGYTALSLKALKALQLHKIFKRYGVPNDLLVKLNIALCTVKEVEIKPVYRIGEQSKMNVLRVIPPIAWLLIKSFFKRLWLKYLFRDFHPLFLLYHFSFVSGLILIPYAGKIIYRAFIGQRIAYETLFMVSFLFISGLQALLFAMWMDMQDNDRLYKN